MHILFLSDNFPPEVNAPATRTFEHCREWVKAGHQVTVVTCAPNFPSGKVFAGYKNSLRQTEMMEGIRVIRVWSYVTANEGFLKRTLDYASFMISATIASPFVRAIDVVIATSPQFFTACAGYAVSRLKRKPFVFELRDLWPESIRAVGAMKEGRLLATLEHLEMFLYRRAAMIISLTNAFRDNLVDRGVDGRKIRVVTNGADLSRFRPIPKDEVLTAELALTARFVAGYVGTHGMAHHLETLLDAAEILQARDRDDIALLLLGDGAEKTRLKKIADDKRLGNVRFVDTVSRVEVGRYLSLLDTAIVHLKDSPLFETVIPSKIFEAMAIGLPIVHAVRGESAGIVKKAKAGVVIPPEDPKALADALVDLADSKTSRERLRENGLSAATAYDRKSLADDMLRDIDDLVKSNSGRISSSGGRTAADRT